jgi:small subunit ribosomal protein S1
MVSNDLGQESTTEAGGADLEALLQEGYGFTPLKRGEVREGVIVSIGSSEILIDLSGKTEGVVAGRELERMPKEMLDSIKVGDEVLAYVVNPEDKNGNIVLSLTRAQLEKDWREAERLFEAQEMFSGHVAGFNKGGLIVRLGKVRGFVPASQLDSNRHPRLNEAGLTPEERWGELTGETLQLKVIEIDRERNRLILSERAAMREWRQMQKEKLLADLTEGEIRKGKVISLADFGAFVDLGGADGLIHLSELSWKRVNHPREVLRVGEEVEVYVLNVNRERRRIGLSLKRLQPDPWTLVDEKYNVDQLVEGVITKLAKFGAFACIVGDEEIEGLIHISELSEDHIAHPKEVVQENQVVTLRIIRIDTDQRRMGLSLKRVDQAEYADLDWQAELAASEEESAEEASAIAADSAEPEMEPELQLEPIDSELQDEAQPESVEPVAEATDGDEPAAEATDDDAEPVAEVTDDDAEPVAEATDGDEPVAEATDGAEPVAEATDGAEPVTEVTDGAEPVTEVTDDAEPAADEPEIPSDDEDTEKSAADSVEETAVEVVVE